MHELGILYHVVKTVQGFAAEQGLSQIEAIVLQVGELSPVVPRYLEACFPAAIDGTPLEHTQLRIEMIPANGLCGGCGKVFRIPEAQGVCPHCGGTAYETLSGKDFCIKEIVAR